MLENKYISVIIPTYNRYNFIADAVRSVLDQDVENLEIIVVDDGSTDVTQDILQPYKQSIRYIYQDNRGVSAARNRGVQESHGELIAFLDSDDIWSSGKLKAQIDKLCSEDFILSFEGVEWFVDREEDQIYINKTRDVKFPRCDEDGYVIDPVLDVAEGRYLHLGTMLCRKRDFFKIGLFDEGLCLGEDEDWFSRASHIAQFHYIPKPYLRRRFHANQTKVESEESIRSLIRVFDSIRTRTRGVHAEAYAAANQRLAAKWSHLANLLANQGNRLDACRAASIAFFLEPYHIERLLKACLVMIGWRP
jgi:glycosyltransferase involved in cell wall biosynthesis